MITGTTTRFWTPRATVRQYAGLPAKDHVFGAIEGVTVSFDSRVAVEGFCSGLSPELCEIAEVRASLCEVCFSFPNGGKATSRRNEQLARGLASMIANQ